MSTGTPPLPRSKRIALIDVMRGVALLAMASYHFTWDLEFFGYVEPGLTAFGGWKVYARCIASSFLFLVGVSLVLAHGRGIRWNGFWKRLAMVVAAALAITAVTFYAFHDGFIFFGILHQIALASLLGLAFLRLPAFVILMGAVAAVVSPFYLRAPFFDHPALWWVGLSTVNPHSNDYVPLLPWFGAVLAGIAVAKLATSSGLFGRLAELSLPRWLNPLVLIGRHSLAFYLVHQPVLIACIWVFSQVMPAHVETSQAVFLKLCQASCEQSRTTSFCVAYCGCMLAELEDGDMLNRLDQGDRSPQLKARVSELAGMCTARTDDAGGEMQ